MDNKRLFRLNIKYLAAFILLFALEFLIAVFVHDSIIRPNVGDILVVILLYCVIKAFVNKDIKHLPLYLFIFAVAVEISQYFHLADMLHIHNRVIRILMGTSFDFKDILCYFCGFVILSIFEKIVCKLTTDF